MTRCPLHPLTLVEDTLFAFSSLFVIVDPIATVPVFLAMTARALPGRAASHRTVAVGLLAGSAMLRAQRSAVQETEVERAAGRDKDDIAVSPLAMPVLAEPGVISTGDLVGTQARNWSQRAVLLGCLMLVGMTRHATLASAGSRRTPAEPHR